MLHRLLQRKGRWSQQFHKARGAQLEAALPYSSGQTWTRKCLAWMQNNTCLVAIYIYINVYDYICIWLYMYIMFVFLFVLFSPMTLEWLTNILRLKPQTRHQQPAWQRSVSHLLSTWMHPPVGLDQTPPRVSQTHGSWPSGADLSRKRFWPWTFLILVYLHMDEPWWAHTWSSPKIQCFRTKMIIFGWQAAVICGELRHIGRRVLVNITYVRSSCHSCRRLCWSHRDVHHRHDINVSGGRRFWRCGWYPYVISYQNIHCHTTIK